MLPLLTFPANDHPSMRKSNFFTNISTNRMSDSRNLADTLLFQSQSPSGSTDGDEDGYEKASVLYDTVVLDTPIDENETQLENFCFDTEVVDTDDDGMGHMENEKVEQTHCDFDIEIVLDSEDEGSCRTKTATLFDDGKITSTSENNVSGKMDKQSPCLDSDSIDKQFSAVKKGSSTNPSSSDGKKDVPQLSIGDHEKSRLEYVDSQEPKESSEAAALCFVDNFLSFHDVDMCQGVEERLRKKSPLVSSAKGTQRLAKTIKRGSPVKEMGTFEWLGSCQQEEASFSKRVKVSSEFGYRDLHYKGKRSNKHVEELSYLHGDNPRHSLSSLKDQGSNVSIGIENESERNLVNASFKELDDELTSEKFEAGATARDIPDMFDVGISTQIAAEAMEALYYGLPPGCKPDDTYEAQENTLTDPQTKSRTHLLPISPHKVAACKLGGVAKESIRRKRSARSYKDASSSSWNCNQQELSHRIKLKTYKRKQSKFDESVSSNNLKNSETYVSPSLPDTQTMLRKQLSREDSKHSEGRVPVQKITDQVDKPRLVSNNAKEGSMLTYKRKRKRVVADPPPKLLSGKQECSKLHSYASAEAFNAKLSERQQSSRQEAAVTRLFRLVTWNCPKGKRTHRKVPIHSSGESNMHASFTSVGAQGPNLDSVRSPKMPEDDETNSSNFNNKGRLRTSLSRPSLENNYDESLLRQKCNVQVAGAVADSDLAVTGIRSSAWDLDQAKAAQTGKPFYVELTSIINGSNKQNIGGSLRKSIKPSGTECNSAPRCKQSVNEASLKNRSYLYQRRPCNKNLPKPSLLKELVGLGILESMSDFTHRGFRTRKELAHVRVLFSQHLDDDVIKQQKKIAARLGISITSSSMDATHFIADNFARTRNMLEAIALGKSVVTHLWLDSCGQASCLLDEKNYILRDSKREKEIGFSMAVSLARAREYPLLKDKRVFITQNVKPNKEMITSLVKAVGGELVGETSQRLAANNQKIPDDLLILSCEQDLSICSPLREKGAAVYSSELLLNGIVIQKLEYDRHQLFPKFVKEKRKIPDRNRHSRSSRKR